jgi:hypothetical protein
MALAISHDEFEDADFDAEAARNLSTNTQALISKVTEEAHALRDAIAAKYSEQFLRTIKHRAARGYTDAECILRDRWIPLAHRDAVIQLIKQQLDERGFNVLSYPRFSFFGQVTVFQIEW